MILLFIATILFSFLAFLWISWKASRYNAGKLFGKNAEVTNMATLNYKHAAGTLLLGFLPLALIPASNLSFLKVVKPVSMGDVTTFSLLLVLVALSAIQLAEKKKQCFMHHPKAIHNFIFYITLRALFLVCYEIFFRGFILFGCVSLLGIAPAIVINIALYMLMHTFCERAEILACIPFGLILCWMSLVFQSIWPPVILHLVLSLVYEIILFRYYFLTTKAVEQ